MAKLVKLEVSHMGIEVNGVGIIAVICRRCGFKLYWYAIGDNSNRSKFSGPPTPAKALSGYDGGHCPLCGGKLSRKPTRLLFMTQGEFNERYVIGEYKLLLKRQLITSVTPSTTSIHSMGEERIELQTLEVEG